MKKHLKWWNTKTENGKLLILRKFGGKGNDVEYIYKNLLKK